MAVFDILTGVILQFMISPTVNRYHWVLRCIHGPSVELGLVHDHKDKMNNLGKAEKDALLKKQVRSQKNQRRAERRRLLQQTLQKSVRKIGRAVRTTRQLDDAVKGHQQKAKKQRRVVLLGGRVKEKPKDLASKSFKVSQWV